MTIMEIHCCRIHKSPPKILRCGIKLVLWNLKEVKSKWKFISMLWMLKQMTWIHVTENCSMFICYVPHKFWHSMHINIILAAVKKSLFVPWVCDSCILFHSWEWESQGYESLFTAASCEMTLFFDPSFWFNPPSVATVSPSTLLLFMPFDWHWSLSRICHCPGWEVSAKWTYELLVACCYQILLYAFCLMC